MSNVISLSARRSNFADEQLSLGNGLMSVLICLLVLNGSSLAETEREKEFVVWLAERDQAVFGAGTVGFEISKLPRTVSGFRDEKLFLLKVIAAAAAKACWHELDYSPAEQMTLDCLTKFRALIIAFDADNVEPENYREWKDAPPEFAAPAGFPACARHNALLHFRGCVVCNDAAS